MLYILKIIGKCLPVAKFKHGFESVSCHTYNIYVQQTLSKTGGASRTNTGGVLRSFLANVHPAASR